MKILIIKSVFLEKENLQFFQPERLHKTVKISIIGCLRVIEKIKGEKILRGLQSKAPDILQKKA